MTWLLGVIQKHFWRVIVYTIFALCIGAVLLLAFKDRITNNTKQSADSISNSLAGATVKVGFGGCAHFSGYPKEKK